MVLAVNNAALNNIQQILISDVRIEEEDLNLSTSEIKQVRIAGTENNHDIASITTQLTKAVIDKYIGKRIQFHYGPKFSGKTFYGYVLTINPNQQYQTDTVVDILCLGTTWPMQSGSPKFYVNKTAPEVLGEVVTKYGLGCQVDDHPYRWPALSQTEESDWEFVQTLATRIGYCIYVYGGVVRLVDPIRILSESGVYQRYVKADDILDASRKLLEFNPTTQSLSIRDNVKPSFGYFKGQEVVLSQPAGVIPYKMSTDTPVADEDMSKVYTEAWERRADYWVQNATARIHGDVSIYPGMNISIQVSTNSTGKNEYDGVWLVRGVDHSFTNNSFQTQLTLARDKNAERVAATDFRWFFTGTAQGNPRVDVDTNTNKWNSSWETIEKISSKLGNL